MNFSIIINNQVFSVSSKSTLLQVIENSNISIPRFCYHEKLSVAGNCRMCLVEVQKSPKPVVSCAMPVSKGMIVFTESTLLKKDRESILEFLLVNHPLDCPICDQGGECDLQDLTFAYGSDRGRNLFFKRSVEDKECGPIIKTIMTRCIHCTRCVRFSTEILGHEVLGASSRGEKTEIGTYVQSFIKSELSGNLVDLCPVGALTSKPYAFTARPWELKRVETIDFFDAVCSNISLHLSLSTKRLWYKKKFISLSTEKIVRILPRHSGNSFENWISDKTRYSFDGLINQRLLSAQFFKLDKSLINSTRIGAFIGELSDLESLYVISQFLKFLGSSDFQVGKFTLKKNKDIPFFYGLNNDFNFFEKINAVCLLSVNPRNEASILNTFLRVQQNKRNLLFISIGVYSFLRFKQNHFGNGLRNLLTFLENRHNFSSKYYLLSKIFFLFSFENYKSKNNLFYENLIKYLSQKFYLKTKNSERLGILHSSIGTLNACHLGLENSVRSQYNLSFPVQEKFSTLFLINLNDFSLKLKNSFQKSVNFIWMSTHRPTTFVPNIIIPIKTLYEKNGHTFNIENKLKKFNKVLSSNTEIWSIESFFFYLAKETYNWKGILQSFWKFDKEILFHLIEKKIPSFFFNFFIVKEEQKKGTLTLFSLTNSNFYFTDPISSHSLIMSQSALFLEKQTSFVSQ